MQLTHSRVHGETISRAFFRPLLYRGIQPRGTRNIVDIGRGRYRPTVNQPGLWILPIAYRTYKAMDDSITQFLSSKLAQECGFLHAITFGAPSRRRRMDQHAPILERRTLRREGVQVKPHSFATHRHHTQRALNTGDHPPWIERHGHRCHQGPPPHQLRGATAHVVRTCTTSQYSGVRE